MTPETRQTEQQPAEQLDENALNELREALGNDTFEMLLSRCSDDIAERLLRLEQAQAAGDHHKSRALAHQLKGLFSQFGAPNAARIASAAETGADDAIAQNVFHLQRSAAAVIAAFATIRGTPAPG